MNPYNKIIEDLSNADYHANTEAVSNSQLSRVLRSPATINAKMKQTPSLRWGSLVHLFILEQHKFEREVAVMPDGLDSGKGAKARVEEFELQNAGREILSADEMVQLTAIRDAVYRDDDAVKLLLPSGRVEHSIFWEDKLTGVKCRCRPDLWRNDNIVVDLKTTSSGVDSWSFGASAWEYGYDRQSAFYADGILAVTGKPIDAFVFIAIEGKEEPMIQIECYNVEPAVMEIGRSRYRTALEIYKKCLDSGSFPKKMVKGIKPLTLPKYASI